VEAPSFVDECTVHVRGGAGGNGRCRSVERPTSPVAVRTVGTAVAGGDVVFLADHNVTSLHRPAPCPASSRRETGSTVQG
jgi:GTPase